MLFIWAIVKNHMYLSESHLLLSRNKKVCEALRNYKAIFLIKPLNAYCANVSNSLIERCQPQITVHYMQGTSPVPRSLRIKGC